jgi:hypothetical protein
LACNDCAIEWSTKVSFAAEVLVVTQLNSVMPERMLSTRIRPEGSVQVRA